MNISTGEHFLSKCKNNEQKLIGLAKFQINNVFSSQKVLT